MLSYATGKIRLIYATVGATQGDKGVDIVVVPGVWADNGLSPGTRHCTWVKPLLASNAPDIRVFFFDYRLDVDGSSLWNQLLGQGYALRNTLNESRAVETRPLLFICHSLGGLIVKRTLTLELGARKGYEDILSGIIFLGTPHLETTTAEGWQNLTLLMKSRRKDISRENMTEPEAEFIASTCRQFGARQFHQPILSVYEQQETKFRDNLFSIRRKQNQSEVLITKTMIQVNSPRESFLGVEKNHMELWNVDENSTLYKSLVQYIFDVARYAPRDVRDIFEDSAVNTFRTLNTRAWSSTSSVTGPLPFTPETIDSSDSNYSTRTSEKVTNMNMPTILVEGDGVARSLIELPFFRIASITRNPQFFGRSSVIEKIDRAFCIATCADRTLGIDQGAGQNDDTINPTSFVLCGMAGIGKTETAIEYVYSRRGHFDAIIWIFADTAQNIGTQFINLAQELGCGSATESIDEVSAREIVKGWLASPDGYLTKNNIVEKVQARWLMVFDNADDPDIIYDWLPDLGPGCILVTSKYPYVRENTYRLERGCDLEALPIDIGGEMLRTMSGRTNEAGARESSMRIVDELGGLPFAISQMSGVIRQKHLSLTDFEEWYREDPTQLHQLKISQAPSSYKHTIATMFTIEQLKSSAYALLRVLSVLDPDTIPEELLVEGANEVTYSDYPIKKRDFFEARAELIHMSLVTRNMATNELKVHRLVQKVVREMMSVDVRSEVFAAASSLTSATWPYVCGTDPTRNQKWRYPVGDRFATHIRQLRQHFGPSILDGSLKGTATSGFLFSSYAWYACERGHFEQTEAFGHLARTILTHLLETRSSDDERITHWLGEAYHCISLSVVMTGTADGIEEAKIWLDILNDRIAKHNQVSDNISLASAHNQMGICFLSKQNVNDGMNSFRKSLSTFLEIENRPQFSGTFPAISLAYLYALQQLPDLGEDVLKATLKEHEEVLGQDDTSTTECGHIWRAMGNVRNAQKRYAEALHYHERAAKNMKATLGDLHYFTGDCLYSLAVDQMRLNDKEKASLSLDAAINAFTAASHSEAQAARAMWKKACVFKELGRDQDSEKMLQKAMDLRHKCLPADRRAAADLTDKDWTEPIFYWSK